MKKGLSDEALHALGEIYLNHPAKFLMTFEHFLSKVVVTKWTGLAKKNSLIERIIQKMKSQIIKLWKMKTALKG